MMSRVLPLFLIALLLPTGAVADPLRYNFSATVDGVAAGLSGIVPIGTVITGGFQIDPDATRLAYSEGPTPPDGALEIPGLMSSAIYDASSFLVWATVANTTITMSGTELDIQNVQPGSYGDDHWRLFAATDEAAHIGGYATTNLGIVLNKMFGTGLDSSDLLVPDLANWYGGPLGSDRRLIFRDATGAGLIGADLTALTAQPVPEPSTIALLAMSGVAARLIGRRRRATRRRP